MIVNHVSNFLIFYLPFFYHLCFVSYLLCFLIFRITSLAASFLSSLSALWSPVSYLPLPFSYLEFTNLNIIPSISDRLSLLFCFSFPTFKFLSPIHGIVFSVVACFLSRVSQIRHYVCFSFLTIVAYFVFSRHLFQNLGV